MNGLFVQEKLIDHVDLVVAPVLIGGKDTATVVDGASFCDFSELSKLCVLKLEECTQLEDSYIRLQYRVIA